MKTLTSQNLIERVKIDENGCWIWQGALKKPGCRSLPYGWVTFRNRHMNAHRAAWIVNYGDIPDGMVVCHRCDVPACVNPNHLFLGTASDNMQDMWGKRRHKLPSEGIIGSLSSKVDLTMVKEIRNLIAQGQKQRDIAAKFGINAVCR